MAEAPRDRKRRESIVSAIETILLPDNSLLTPESQLQEEDAIIISTSDASSISHVIERSHRKTPSNWNELTTTTTTTSAENLFTFVDNAKKPKHRPTPSLSPENSFSVMTDIHHHDEQLLNTNQISSGSSANNFSSTCTALMTEDSPSTDTSQDKMTRQSDITSLSTENSFSIMSSEQDKVFLSKPATAKIVVKEKEKKKLTRHDHQDKQNPHIILVEPEHAAGVDLKHREESTETVQSIKKRQPAAASSFQGAFQGAWSENRRDSTGSSLLLDQHLSVINPPARRRAKSYPSECESESTAKLSSMKGKEEEIKKLPNFRKLAQLKMKAKRWMKRSGVGEVAQGEMEITTRQSRRPHVEIPRSLKLDVWKEAHPIVQKIHEAYKASLGEHDPLTELARAHLETHQANFKGP